MMLSGHFPPDIPRTFPSIRVELFNQSSFYLKNIVSSIQLLFKQRYLHFSPGEMSGGNVLDPMMIYNNMCIYNNI